MKIYGMYNNVNNVHYGRKNINNSCSAINSLAFCSSLNTNSDIKNIGRIIREIPLINSNTGTLDKCYLIYKKNEKSGVLKLFVNNEEKIRDLSKKISNDSGTIDFLEKYNHYTMSIILDKLQTINPQISELYNDLRIAECGYVIIDDTKNKNLMISKGYKPADMQKEFVFIEDFYVDKNKSYRTAFKDTALGLFEILSTEKRQNILAIAQAIGDNSSSPIHLYLRAGFKPLNMTLEEIEEHIVNTKKGRRLDPKLTVLMYLPNDAYLYQIIKRNDFGTV